MDFLSLSFFYGKGKNKENYTDEKSFLSFDAEEQGQINEKTVKAKIEDASYISPKTSISRKRKLHANGFPATNQTSKRQHQRNIGVKRKVNRKSKSLNEPQIRREGESRAQTDEQINMSHSEVRRNQEEDVKLNSITNIDGLKCNNADQEATDVDFHLAREQERNSNSETLPNSTEKKIKQFIQLKLMRDFASLMKSDDPFASTSPPKPALRSPRGMSLLKSKEKSQQMLLDFGQKMEGPIQCSECGLTYNAYEKSDEQFHAKYHKKCLSILPYNISSKDRILQIYPDGGAAIVLPDSENGWAKVKEIKRHVDSELGFVAKNKNSLPSMIFLYVMDNQVVGFCMAQVIKKGYKMLSTTGDKEKEEQVIPTGMGRESPSQSLPYCCSTVPEPARCGINKIWVIRRERRRGVATKLLDVVRDHFSVGKVISKMDLAFSDPTTDGMALAARYVGSPNFLVYNNCGY